MRLLALVAVAVMCCAPERHTVRVPTRPRVDEQHPGYVVALRGRVELARRAGSGWAVGNANYSAASDFEMISDESAPFVSPMLPLAIRSDYRGKEGFQDLRWGMTPGEVRQLLPDATALTGDDLQWVAKLAGYEARCIAMFETGRLGGMAISFSDATHKDIAPALSLKFGTPLQSRNLSSYWETGETRVWLETEQTSKVITVTKTTLNYRAKAFEPWLRIRSLSSAERAKSDF